MTLVARSAREAGLKAWCLIVSMMLVSGSRPAAAEFDQAHGLWNELLAQHVVLINKGRASQVSYTGFKANADRLKAYLDALSAVPAAEFASWSKDDRLAFLINAYNAYTVQLILTRYPKLASIKDLGSFLRSPWKQAFIKLQGRDVSLDDIEHGMIRVPGAYDDPRIHMAVNCASVGCPMLREEAYVSVRLDAQLDDQVQRFLSDRSRNRYSPKNKTLEVSSIFKWYAEDFNHGYRGIESVPAFLAYHADRLADAEGDREIIRKRAAAGIDYLDYDWALNDRKP